jgi:hypothetical protein
MFCMKCAKALSAVPSQCGRASRGATLLRWTFCRVSWDLRWICPWQCVKKSAPGWYEGMGCDTWPAMSLAFNTMGEHLRSVELPQQKTMVDAQGCDSGEAPRS